METPRIESLTSGTAHPSRPSPPDTPLLIDSVSAKEARRIHKPVLGVDLALDEVGLGWGESAFIDPRTGRAV